MAAGRPGRGSRRRRARSPPVSVWPRSAATVDAFRDKIRHLPVKVMAAGGIRDEVEAAEVLGTLTAGRGSGGGHGTPVS